MRRGQGIQLELNSLRQLCGMFRRRWRVLVGRARKLLSSPPIWPWVLLNGGWLGVLFGMERLELIRSHQREGSTLGKLREFFDKFSLR